MKSVRKPRYFSNEKVTPAAVTEGGALCALRGWGLEPGALSRVAFSFPCTPRMVGMAASSVWWETCGSHVKHVTKTQGVVTAAVRAVHVSVRARFLSPYAPDAAHISHLHSDITTVLIPVLEMRTL